MSPEKMKLSVMYLGQWLLYSHLFKIRTKVHKVNNVEKPISIVCVCFSELTPKPPIQNQILIYKTPLTYDYTSLPEVSDMEPLHGSTSPFINYYLESLKKTHLCKFQTNDFTETNNLWCVHIPKCLNLIKPLTWNASFPKWSI